MDNPVLEKLIEFQQRLDLVLARIDELESVFKRYIELTQSLRAGVPPPPPPRVN
jgi:hypothetical protein